MKEGTLKISVVIPTYNRKHCIMDAVASVLAQTVRPDEILVIDDGSSDGTADLFKKADPLVTYLVKENGGVSSARNYGVRRAKGDWIGFLDSDDAWLPEKLARQIACLQETETRACYTRISSEDGQPRGGFHEVCPDFEEGAFFKSEDSSEFLCKSEGHPMIQTLLVEKALFLAGGGFDESLAVAEDTAFFYGLVLGAPFSYVNEDLVILDRHRTSGGLSDNPSFCAEHERYRCYLRVQSALLWKIISDRERVTAARHVSKRVGYFAGRCAERECVLRNTFAARKMACLHLLFGKFAKSSLISVIIVFSPLLGRQFLRRKFKDFR